MNKKEYAAANLEWLKEKGKEEGVAHISQGVLRKVIRSGAPEGKSPKSNNVVTVHYTGRTIDGRVFDSSKDGVPPAFRLRDLIPGWGIALTQMRPGDVWEIYVPASQGYGSRGVDGIPANSTLVFEIELIAVN